MTPLSKERACTSCIDSLFFVSEKVLLRQNDELARYAIAIGAIRATFKGIFPRFRRNETDEGVLPFLYLTGTGTECREEDIVRAVNSLQTEGYAIALIHHHKRWSKTVFGDGHAENFELRGTSRMKRQQAVGHSELIRGRRGNGRHGRRRGCSRCGGRCRRRGLNVCRSARRICRRCG